MLKSEKWPWLSYGWEVVEEVEAEKRKQAFLAELSGHKIPDWFEPSTVSVPANYGDVIQLVRVPFS